MEVEAEAL